MFKIDHLDHLVLTVQDIPRACEFYEQVLGMDVVIFGEGRVALHFGYQKINLHQAGNEYPPFAQNPTPGSADVCFVTLTPLDDVIKHLKNNDIEILLGPVQRTGAIGSLNSVYFRDPDLNLIEVSNHV